jgi:two-component system OmpR family response regulator
MSYILVIDDDPDLANASATVLAADGYETAIQLDIEEAKKAIEARRPDLVLLDVMFPGNASGGFDLARWIAQKSVNGNRIPVLMLSAINQKIPLGFSNQDIDAEWMPVSEFLEKPVDFDALKSKVKAILSRG